MRITAQRQNGLIVLSVADVGPGIAAEDLPYVFERFYRGDRSRSSAAGRTGLGLAISKAIVAAHGGSLDVASPAGVGATFTVRLPTESDQQPDRQGSPSCSSH